MRLKTIYTEQYCENCSYLLIIVETETETHKYCEKCSFYVITDKNDIESQKCC